LEALATEVHAALQAPQWVLLVRRLVHAVLLGVHWPPVGPHPTVHTPFALQV